MNKLLHHSRTSFHSVIPQWSSSIDQEIQYAASRIGNASFIENDPNLYAPLYRNLSMFKSEGERPIMHTPVLIGIYASEGWFMKQLQDHKKFVTKDPQKAHLYYLPFSSLMLEEKLHICSNRNKKYMSKCIRSLCNADMKEGFVLCKDVSLPETNVHVKNPLRNLGSNRPSERSILAFFAGKMHGYVWPIVLQHWENKDPDMKIFGRLPRGKGNKNYVHHMKSSKYCICAKGYEVNSPRVVEAIFYECVPMIISDNFVPPFFEVLNWESFAVFVLEKDIPNLKKILLAIPEKRYL
ncbi:putative xylogalacturonan beta-1,3-xylosyltransferase [Rosa chinensis]|uniref:Putative xylogalacturonan beta-1,3-xylosyltransferase n=1 Tax=Rosa chinensis TaxID=74649 RepID=A0A2P6Q053_ROSCH|nr:putative xylogalacturonan beta-1,3-xylosyltransferase [Rosa chinensis]